MIGIVVVLSLFHLMRFDRNFPELLLLYSKFSCLSLCKKKACHKIDSAETWQLTSGPGGPCSPLIPA